MILAFLAHSSHTRSPDSGGAREAAALPTGRESAVVCTPAAAAAEASAAEWEGVEAKGGERSSQKLRVRYESGSKSINLKKKANKGGALFFYTNTSERGARGRGAPRTFSTSSSASAPHISTPRSSRLPLYHPTEMVVPPAASAAAAVGVPSGVSSVSRGCAKRRSMQKRVSKVVRRRCRSERPHEELIIRLRVGSTTR